MTTCCTDPGELDQCDETDEDGNEIDWLPTRDELAGKYVLLDTVYGERPDQLPAPHTSYLIRL